MSEDKREAHESCTGCHYDLGGGRDNCLLCVAHECRDGGGFEAWKPKKELKSAEENMACVKS